MRHRNDLVFPMEEYRCRLDDLRGRMAHRGLDAIITTTPENVCYLTGFESQGHFAFQALVVPLEGEPVSVTRVLEDRGIEVMTWVEQRRPFQDSEDPMEKLCETLGEFGLHDRRVGCERSSWLFTAPLQERLCELCPRATFLDCSGIIEEGRLVKSEHEIDLMRRAARAAESAIRAGMEAVGPGVSENDVAAEMHYAMIKAGSEWPGLSPFVASGDRCSIGHATWAGRIMGPGDSVFLEAGGCLKRYHAALMRTGFIGEPGRRFRQGERAVQQAMEATIEAVRPGITAGEADHVNRSLLGEVLPSIGGQQLARSAYSIGIAFSPDWGEGILSFRPGDPTPLQPNMTFHLIPWIQMPGEGAIGFTETIRVTEDGCEVLTELERGFFVK